MTLSIGGSIVFYAVFFLFETLLAFVIQNLVQRSGNQKFVYKSDGGVKIRVKGAFVFALMSVICCLVAGLRYNVGTDYKNYLPIFNTVSDISGKTPYGTIEPLSSVLMLVCKPFVNGYQVYLGLMAILISFITFYFFKENCDVSSFPFMIFIYFMLMYSASLNAIRQIMSVAIVMLGYRFIMEKKLLKYIIVLVVAALVHKSALLCLPFYFLYFKKDRFSKIKLNLIIAVCMIIPFFIRNIFNILLSISLFSSYDRYFYRNAGYYVVGIIILRLPVLLMIFIFRSKLEERSEKNRFFIILYVMELLFYIIGGNIIWAFRMAYYCLAAEAVLVPQLSEVVNKKYKVIVNVIFVIYYIVIFCYNVIINGHDGILPYTFVG